MLKPKALLKLLESATEKFPNVKNIFIANFAGYLIASNIVNDKDKISIASFVNIWNTYSDIASTKFQSNNNQVSLNFALLDYQNGKIALSSICNELIMGIYTETSDAEYGILLKEIQLLKEKLEPHFKIMIENGEDQKEHE